MFRLNFYNKKQNVFLLIIIVVITSCTVQKTVIYSESEIIGNFINKKEIIDLVIKSDKTFLMKQDEKKEICEGSWKLQNDTVYLFCNKPTYLSSYFTSYSLNVDAKYICKLISNDILILEGKKLKKNIAISSNLSW